MKPHHRFLFLCVDAVTDEIHWLFVFVEDRNNDISFEEDVRLLTIISSIVGQAFRIHHMMEDEKNPLTCR